MSDWKGTEPEAKALDDRLWQEDSGLERERLCRETIRRAMAHGVQSVPPRDVIAPGWTKRLYTKAEWADAIERGEVEP